VTAGVTLVVVPTTRPRYTITDTGAVAEMLDLAQARWPEADRKDLLLRLARAGGDVIARELDDRELAVRGERQRVAMGELSELVDAGVLLSDAAWR
jgi:hypothetical protein